MAHEISGGTRIPLLRMYRHGGWKRPSS